jgi:hypothetical protein
MPLHANINIKQEGKQFKCFIMYVRGWKLGVKSTFINFCKFLMQHKAKRVYHPLFLEKQLHEIFSGRDSFQTQHCDLKKGKSFYCKIAYTAPLLDMRLPL